mgnify:FL=1
MKKFLSVIFVVLMMLALAGCGSDSQYAGVWNATEYQTAGQTLTADQLGDSTLTLDADGTLEADFLGTTGSGEWKETKTGIHISSDIELDCESDGKTMTVNYSGVTIIFEKEGAADDTAADNKTDSQTDIQTDDKAAVDNGSTTDNTDADDQGTTAVKNGKQRVSQ